MGPMTSRRRHACQQARTENRGTEEQRAFVRARHSGPGTGQHAEGAGHSSDTEGAQESGIDAEGAHGIMRTRIAQRELHFRRAAESPERLCGYHGYCRHYILMGYSEYRPA